MQLRAVSVKGSGSSHESIHMLHVEPSRTANTHAFLQTTAARASLANRSSQACCASGIESNTFVSPDPTARLHAGASSSVHQHSISHIEMSVSVECTSQCAQSIAGMEGGKHINVLV